MAHLESSGIRSKVRISAGGRKTGGSAFSRGALYQLVRNHIYVGEIEHKGSICPGEHDGIIDRELWDQVQALLDENRQGKKDRSRTASGSLLTVFSFPNPVFAVRALEVRAGAFLVFPEPGRVQIQPEASGVRE